MDNQTNQAMRETLEKLLQQVSKRSEKEDYPAKDLYGLCSSAIAICDCLRRLDD